MLAAVQPVSISDGSHNRIHAVVRTIASQQNQKTGAPVRRSAGERDQVIISSQARDWARWGNTSISSAEEQRMLHYIQQGARWVRALPSYASLTSPAAADGQQYALNAQAQSDTSSSAPSLQAQIARLRYEESAGKWIRLERTGIFFDLSA